MSRIRFLSCPEKTEMGRFCRQTLYKYLSKFWLWDLSKVFTFVTGLISLLVTHKWKVVREWISLSNVIVFVFVLECHKVYIIHTSMMVPIIHNICVFSWSWEQENIIRRRGLIEIWFTNYFPLSDIQVCEQCWRYYKNESVKYLSLTPPVCETIKI